ncbi:nucleolar protein dao-5-like [Sycon ciliatum]|uniref:nucleolar protein dao-5-like n=1 Tax=Sycon ciliatum TaxID=27933 RepID=UPI0031F68620|eukprot:scpid30656/ scgid26322/ Zinc finger CW-type PWWP domain protein 1
MDYDDLDDLLEECENEVDSWPAEKPPQRNNIATTAAASTDVGPTSSLVNYTELPATPESDVGVAEESHEPRAEGTHPDVGNEEPCKPSVSSTSIESCKPSVSSTSIASSTSENNPDVQRGSLSASKRKPSFAVASKAKAAKTPDSAAKRAPKFGTSKATPAAVKAVAATASKPSEGTNRRLPDEAKSKTEPASAKANSPAELSKRGDTNKTIDDATEPSSPVVSPESNDGSNESTPAVIPPTVNKSTKPSFSVKQRPQVSAATSKSQQPSKQLPTAKPKKSSDGKAEKLNSQRKNDSAKSTKKEELKAARVAKLEEKNKAKEGRLQKKAEKLQHKQERAMLQEEKKKNAEEKKKNAEEKKQMKADKRYSKAGKMAVERRRNMADRDHNHTVDSQASPDDPVTTEVELQAPKNTIADEGDDTGVDDSDTGSVTSLEKVVQSLKETDVCFSDIESLGDAEQPDTTDAVETVNITIHQESDDAGDLRSIAESLSVYNLEEEWNEVCNRWTDDAQPPSGNKNKEKRKRVKTKGKKSHHNDDDEYSMPSMMSGFENNGEVWVECTLCSKWRRMQGNVDASSVPGDWQCSMSNDSKRNTCDIPEENWDEMHESYTFAPCHVTLGSVVWARVNGYPWWPGLVDVDPDYGSFANFEDDDDHAIDRIYEPNAFHVVFGFDTAPTRAWVDRSNVKAFDKNSKPSDTGQIKLTQKKQLKRAAAIACDCLTYSIDDRLAKFGHEVSMRSRSKKRRSSHNASFDSAGAGSPSAKKSRSSHSEDTSFCASEGFENAPSPEVPWTEMEAPDSPEY